MRSSIINPRSSVHYTDSHSQIIYS